MVRGRRVKAVFDDCCSPDPKRRSPNIITDFLKGVVESQDGRDIVLLQVDDIDDVPKTPVIKNMTCKEGPPTPHRIELCPDEGKIEAKPKAKKRLNCQLSTKDNNHKVTDYFPVRRSVRKTKKTVMEEKQRSLEEMLRNGVEEGLEVRVFSNKGRGVVTSRPFTKGDFVVEYSGDLIDINEAKRRELKYAQDLNTGCYMYYFKHNNQQYCVDATAETGKLGRLVNHSRNGNLITRTVSVDNKPRLVLIAKDDIKAGDEITYDYGDRSKESLKHHPWLAY
ncbi:histone-lysine N-methyltransferase PR-Set7 [Tribolium madens]|uniref:histone-lysine N-methyltransferase PR-Set7 n=1 Tax=Tribolium madens TaxID=41895 RepID=UPI001CF723A7|nr:histone-lysine N-methyltransferase PR-Set7 [Tribolium madens]